ncbi:MAG: NUDIX hydrolase [Candidatus Kerfeldbacteria bacterium]
MTDTATPIKPWKVRASKKILETPWLTVRQDTCELSDGSVIDDYFVTERADVVGVVPITEDGTVVMNRQYKHGIGEIVMEIPAGMIDKGEEPEAAGRRELEEETGYIAGEMTLLSAMVASPTSQNNLYYVYLAKDVKPGGTKETNAREQIQNELVPLDRVEEMIATGEINVLWTVAALYLAINKTKQT